MSKNYVDVIGITRGKEPEVLGTFDERKDANWHVKNTYTGEDKCLVKTTTVKGDKYVKADIAEDRSVYVKSTAKMEITDLERLVIETEDATLLQLLNSGELEKKSDVDKIQDLFSEETEAGVLVVHAEDTPFPHSKVKKKLEDTLIKTLVGETEEAAAEEEETAEEETEEVEEEETEVDEEEEESTEEEETEEDEDEEVEVEVEEDEEGEVEDEDIDLDDEDFDLDDELSELD